MPRSRPASNPISYHKHTNQFYVTRGGKRIYLGCDKEEALKKYYHLGLGYEFTPEPDTKIVNITIKDLANRFISAQQANWRNPDLTMKSYKQWLGRFLKDHPKLRLEDFTVEIFARWKLSLKRRGYASETINHYLSAVRAMFSFAEDVELIRDTFL